MNSQPLSSHEKKSCGLISDVPRIDAGPLMGWIRAAESVPPHHETL